VCSWTKQGLTCTRKLIMVVLEKAHQQKAPFLLQNCYYHYIWCHIRCRNHRYIIGKAKAVSRSKERKINGKAVDAANGLICTRTEHYFAYLLNVKDVLNKNNMQGYYSVIENAPIYTLAKVLDLIESRRYKCYVLHHSLHF